MYRAIFKHLPNLIALLILTSTAAQATNHIINFGGTVGFKYEPSSLNVSVGDTVTWTGVFSGHPLSSTSVPAGAASFSKNSGSSFSYPVTVAGDYNYKCDFHAGQGMVGSFTAIISSVRNDLADLPVEFDLKQNFPNPFNPSTTIEFNLTQSEFTTLKVFNTLGQEMVTLIAEKLNPGTHAILFEGNNLPGGIYFYQLKAGKHSEIRKMTLLK